NLPAVCGRVCPQENQCEAVCVLNKKKIPINIGALERYAADYALTHEIQPLAHSRNDLAVKIAAVGSGPAGLTCSADLAKRGFNVTLFESLHTAGGVLVYGIPEFRLPKKIVQDEVNYIRSLGVELKVDTLIGNTFTLEELFKSGFKAAFVAVGAGLPQFLGIEGENLPGVYSANEFLTRVNLMKAYKFPEYATPINIGKKVAVIGGGNVALDSARVSLRLGSQVALIYRRSENEMPGRLEEIKNAKEEGVSLNILTQPIRIIANPEGSVGALECIKMQLGEPDASGRRRPVPIENSNFILEADTVIIAIGQNPNPLLPRITQGLKTNKNGTIIVDENQMTSIPGVFAGGDITTGADTVISAMGAGKKAALAIEKYIKEQYGQDNG
ncbi:MAG: NADPH-dependent glutamate synthase, partial [Candidatus Omnitrophica bacterium]|nr:NADPH-dependent glutamate synthase [Candidatus Omnitrophota bacterium]